MKRAAIVALVLLSGSAEPTAARTINNANLEIAAKMNVAENICDINFGSGPGSLVHFVMLAAAELRVSVDAAAQMADVRSREIMKFIVSSNRTAEFCRNAKSGKL
ncbi:MAG: hypothetical protein E5Y79_28345 [Mesorhizobium sp.]|uniref:hypothetical protein n=1 Tax=Mesorhizobium sp. TaxID=1871066 RepID=UPI00121C22E8|nr:hypothetical protein [Mesorhizobium sp.]TIL56718.1 MAG: hypothetical protein E5Y79_28345 [Mesorhizobium sp.]